MTEDLFSRTAASADFTERAVSPMRELGAYEALWAKDGAWFKSIAAGFREHEGAIPSDFVSKTNKTPRGESPRPPMPPQIVAQTH